MRSQRLGLVVVAMLVAGGLTWLCWPEPARPRPDPRRAGPPLAAAGFQGVASCSAAACHGNGLPGTPCGECTTWAIDDPHARAYSVLLEPRSQSIQKKLDPGNGEPKPQKNPLCLNCHVQPGITRAKRSPRFRLEDGVGCESCHGEAGKWLHEHTLPCWKERSPQGKKELGLIDTANLQVRAEVCTTCHVGKGDIEVNHDLIAAGHPRLRFEFAAYLANYPRHWPEDADSKRYKDKDPEVVAWLAGQKASGEAALRLLAHRAGSSRPGAIWPELAELDCYACHHDLAPGPWRQARFRGQAKPGSLLLNEWYYAALPVAVKGFDLAPLKPLMSRPAADRSEVAGQATRLANELAGKDLAAPDRKALLLGLVDEGEARRPSWDRDTQRYLGAAALTARTPGLAQPVKELGSLLNKTFRVPLGSLDSPAGYDPEAVDKGWKMLREQLEKGKQP